MSGASTLRCAVCAGRHGRHFTRLGRRSWHLTWTCGRASRCAPRCVTGCRLAEMRRGGVGPVHAAAGNESGGGIGALPRAQPGSRGRHAAVPPLGDDLSRRRRSRQTAAEATLQGAWAADDAADMVEAAKLRRDVAALWGEPADLSNGTAPAGRAAPRRRVRRGRDSRQSCGKWGDQWGNRRAGCVRCRGRRVPARPRRGPRRRPPPALERRGEPCASARSPNPEILERAAAAVAQAFPYYCRYYCHWSEADEAIPAERRTNRPDSRLLRSPRSSQSQ